MNWELFATAIALLLAVAYYADSRLRRLQASIDCQTGVLRELNIRAENAGKKLLAATGPARLTPAGQRLLARSGLKAYIDSHQAELLAQCDSCRDSYEFRDCVFRLFAGLTFDDLLARDLKEFAFTDGVSTDLLRRVGAVYFSEFSEVSR